jgi:hypothetical protein
LGEEILPFLEPLMARLMEALQSNKRELQEICLVSSAFVQILSSQAPLRSLLLNREPTRRFKLVSYINQEALGCDEWDVQAPK